MDVASLTETKIAKLHEFRKGLLAFAKSDLSHSMLSNYWEANRGKLRPSGITDNVGRYIQTVGGIEDVDALDDARDHIVEMLDTTLSSLSNAEIRPILDELILKVKDAKLATLLKEFNAIKNNQPNLAAIGLRTILCLTLQERAKLTQPESKLATLTDIKLGPMLDEAIDKKVFDDARTKLLIAFKKQGLKETFDNVVHKPGNAALITWEDLSSLVQNTVNKLIAAIV